jgi:hypothetical protein
MITDRKPAASLSAALLSRDARHLVAPLPDAPAERLASVRIAPELRLRLRLLAALTRRTQRAVIRAAIDRFLTR